jgi:hypothetical protein
VTKWKVHLHPYLVEYYAYFAMVEIFINNFDKLNEAAIALMLIGRAVYAMRLSRFKT